MGGCTDACRRRKVAAVQRVLPLAARCRTHADRHQAAVGGAGLTCHERLLFEVQLPYAALDAARGAGDCLRSA